MNLPEKCPRCGQPMHSDVVVADVTYRHFYCRGWMGSDGTCEFPCCDPAHVAIVAENAALLSEVASLDSTNDALTSTVAELVEENAKLKARVAELEAVVELLHPERLNEIDVDGETCCECGDTYELRYGSVPTSECDPCAHAILIRVRTAALAAAVEAKKGDING